MLINTLPFQIIASAGLILTELARNIDARLSNGSTAIMIIGSGGVIQAAGATRYGISARGVSPSTVNNTTYGDINTFASISKVAGIHTGNKVTFFMTNDGELWASGGGGTPWNNTLGCGPLGDTGEYTPIQCKTGVSTYLTNVIDAVSGNGDSFALTGDGVLWAAGYNWDGGLGLGDNATREYFTQSNTDVVQIGMTSFNSGLVLKSDNTVWGTGDNSYGKIIPGGAATYNTWQQISFFDSIDIIQVESGANGSHVLATNGDLYSWGQNTSGRLGDGTTVNIVNPTIVATNVKHVRAVNSCTHIIKNDNTVWATGSGAYGQLAQGNTSNSSNYVQCRLDAGTFVTGAERLRGDENGGNMAVVLDTGAVLSVGYGGYGIYGDGTAVVEHTYYEELTNYPAA